MGATSRRRVTAALTLAFALPAVAAGCGSGEGEGEDLSSNEAGRTVFVEATPRDCQLTKGGAPPGEITFTVRNSGQEPVEFALLSADGKTMIAQSSTGGGLVRDLVVQLKVGDFSTSCQPADRKKPVTTKFVVSDEDPGGGF